MDHRGRFQAQGGGLEESEPWNEEELLQALKGHHLLSGLKIKIPPREAKLRHDSFLKAHRFRRMKENNWSIWSVSNALPWE